MNRIYRLVFNRALGCVQVTSELATSASGGSASPDGVRTAAMPWLRFAMYVALGWVMTVPAFAQVAEGHIVGDAAAPGANRAQVIGAGNGVPVVNITTPSAAGVSRNIYSQFDVGQQGAILNNARGQATTQLAGDIAGNPWLATGSARVILNEVNSANPSQLNGYVEVAGQRAEVIIANPAGIQVNGGGFINVSGATLTTGTPVMAGGALDYYRVGGGTVRIDGAGLDASRTDYTRVLTRALELNGGVWAPQLEVTLGANSVHAATGAVTATTPSAGAPAFALDVSALGGMYANHIRLVGTESGLGVRNAGTLGAQAGQLQVTVEGRLENTGTLHAKGDAHLGARDGVANAGTMSATRELVITTPAEVDNRGGTLNARRIEVNAASLANRDGAIEQTGVQALALNAGVLSNRDGGRIGVAAAAPSGEGGGGGSAGGSAGEGQSAGGSAGGASGGEAPSLELLTDGALNIAGALNNDGGRINAGGGMQLNTADGLDNSGGHIGLRELSLNRGELLNAGGTLDVTGAATVHTTRVDNTGGTWNVGGDLDVRTDRFGNAGGTVKHGGSAASIAVTGSFDNTRGTLASNAGAMRIDAGVLVNEQGRIEHAGQTLDLRTGTVQGREGFIATAGALSLTGGAVDHRDATLSARQLTLRADSLDNRGGRILSSGSDANTVHITGTLDNRDEGLMASQGDLFIRADTFDNTEGTVQHAGTGALNIAANTLEGEGGTLASNGALTLTGHTTNLRNAATSAQRITVATDALTTAGGTLTAAGPDALTITARTGWDNTAGTVITNGALDVRAAALNNRDGQLLAAGAGTSVIAIDGALDNTAGTLATAGALEVDAGRLLNDDGVLQSAGDVSLSSEGELSNRAGVIASSGALEVSADALDNTDGTLQAQQSLAATLATTFDNTRGTALAGDALTVDAHTLVNRDTYDATLTDANAQKGLFGDTIALRMQVLDSTAGQVHATGALDIASGIISNIGGSMDGSGAVSVQADTLDNSAGQLVQRDATGALDVRTTQDLVNRNGGVIGAEGSARVHAGTLLDNQGGTVFSQQQLEVASGGDVLNGSAGLMQSGSALTVSASGRLDNAGGTIDAAGAAQVTAASVNNAGGQLLAGGSDEDDALSITTAGTLDNRGGMLAARSGDVAITAASADNSQAGSVVAQRDMTLSTGAVNNTGGTVFAGRHLAYENSGGTLNNAGGVFGAGDTARITLARIDTSAGGRIQSDTLWLDTHDLNVAGGEVAANELHARLSNLTGVGRLYGAHWLDVAFTGDFTYQAGQRFESDGALDLAVNGRFTNEGVLQTAAALNLRAYDIVNTAGARITASNSAGTAAATLIASNTLDNQDGATLEADLLDVQANTLTNTGDIVGDVVQLEANTLVNGRDLSNAVAAVDYGEGFIGATEYLDVRVANALYNLDAEIFSAGDLSISGRAPGTRTGSLINSSGRIQAEGDAYIAVDALFNERRMFGVENYTLGADEQYLLGWQKAYDDAWAALTPAEQARIQFLNGQPAAYLSPGEIQEKKDLNHRLGWQTVSHASEEMLAALNEWFATVGAPRNGATDGYITDDPTTSADNPAVEVWQRDTFTHGQRIVPWATSAAGLITTGGDLTLDVTAQVRNDKSHIAAGRYLTIAGQTYSGTSSASDARVDNIAVAAELTGERETRGWVYPEIWVMYYKNRSWNSTVAELEGFLYENIVAQGDVLAGATITAGAGTTILAGPIANTTVTMGSGLSGLSGGAVSGPGTQTLGAQGGATRTLSANPDAAAPQVIGTAERPLPGLVAADTGRFDVHTDPNAPYLVTGAPRFASRGPFESSDTLFRMLGQDPSLLHKRLGDGYYEQNLVMDQILELTGRRSLNGNGDALAQYRDLMEGAAAEAARMGLTLGTPLTSMQIASLSHDIVWMVEMEVNGQRVLVPVVYLSAATAERLRSDDAVIAGDTVNIQSTSTVQNDGTINGTRGTWLSADALINTGAITSDEGRTTIRTINDTTNRGVIAGHSVVVDAGGSFINAVTFDGVHSQMASVAAGSGGLSIKAGTDVINEGTLSSQGSALVAAGRDIVLKPGQSDSPAGQVRTSGGTLAAEGSAVVVAGRDVSVTGGGIDAGQYVFVEAGRDASFTATQVHGDDGIAIKAGRDILAGTETTTEAYHSEKKQGRTKTAVGFEDETVHGSSFTSDGNIVMQAGHDIHLTAATVRSDDGAVALQAGNNVTLDAAHERHETWETVNSKKSGTLTTTTSETYTHTRDDIAVGTVVSGNKVAIQAGNDINVIGSAVVSDAGTALVAGHDVNVLAAKNIHAENGYQDTRKTGLTGDGGIGFRLGATSSTTESEGSAITHAGSLIGSTGGQVSIYAGNHYQQTGSDVIGMAGVGISGKTVTIEHAQDTYEGTTYGYTAQDGLHASVRGGAADAGTTAYQSLNRAGEVQDDRLKVMYAAKAAQAIYSTGGLQKVGKDIDNAVSDAKNDNSRGGGMSLRVGVGSATSHEQTDFSATGVHSSHVISGGNTTIVAREGNLAVIGSTVEGVNTTVAALKGDLILLGAEQGNELKNKGKSGGGEGGFTLGSEAGIGVYGSASGSRGSAQGQGTQHVETLIKGSGTTTFISGGDTIGRGAQIIGETVIGRVGGDLLLSNQQDTDTYTSKNTSTTVEGAVGKAGWSASGSAANSATNATYASVQQQTGIQAGKGGYDIRVDGHTQLDGAGIVSTADPSKNYFETGSLGYTHTQNTAAYNAHSEFASASGGTSGGQKSGSGSGGVSQVNDNDSSVTRAAISNGTLIVKDGSGSGSGISRGATELQQTGLKPIFDAQKVSEQLETQQVAAQVAFKAVGDVAQSKTKAYEDAQARKDIADEQLKNPNLSDEDRARWQSVSDNEQKIIAANQEQFDHWKEGGSYKTISHAVAGAVSAGLGGGNALEGALGAAAAELARPLTADETKLVQDLVSFGIGGAAGGLTGAGTGLAGEVNNRQLHPDEIKWLESRAGAFADELYGCGNNCTDAQISAAQNRLITEAAARVDAVMASQFGNDTAAESFINRNPVMFSWGEGFTATLDQYNNFKEFSNYLAQNKEAFTALVDALGTAGWTKRDVQDAYHDELLALASSARAEDGVRMFETFTGDVGMALSIVNKLAEGNLEGAGAEAALAALPWGLAKIVGPTLRPMAAASEGTFWLNGRVIEDTWVNTAGDLTWINPLNGAREVVPDAAFVHVDHILPQNAIKNIPGFTELPADMQRQLLNDPTNLQPMVASANCSKNCKVEGIGEGWSTWNGQPLSDAYKQYLQDAQSQFEAKVRNAVNAHRNAGGGK